MTHAANALYNDVPLTQRRVGALGRVPGERNVIEIEPTMVFEDFAEFPLAGIPSAYFPVGAVDPTAFSAAHKSGAALPQLHSATRAPDDAPTLRTATSVETTELLELFGQ